MKNNESWTNYLNRMKQHSAWETKNISSWDLSLDGAKELNNHLQASADVYYFSIVTSTTEKREYSPNHDPVENTSILIKTRSKLLGSRSGYWADGSKTDSLWFENDGDYIEVKVIKDARFILLSGEPLGEPLVSYGPFVMNSQEEINQAIRDFQNGEMGSLLETFD